MANTFNFGNGNWAQKTEKVLAYNAENDNYKPLPFDFDRGSTATRVNKQGLIETVGVDKPRIDFLNNTKGHLLLEPSRQNVLIYSEALSNWTNIQNATVTDNDIVSPDGSQNASRINETIDNSVHRIFLNPTVASAKHSFSVFLKKGTRKWAYLRLDGATSDQRTWFDLENGVLGTVNSDHIATIEDFGNGWYRCSVSIAGTTYDTTPLGIIAITTGNNVQDYVGNVNEYIYAWGAQLEAGSYATSYIPTQGETNGVTRSAETCNGAGNSTVFNDSEGVLYAEISAFDENQEEGYITISDGSTSDVVWVGFKSGKLRGRFVSTSDNFIEDGNVVIENSNKIACSYSSSNFKVFINGSQIGNTQTITTPLVGIVQLNFDRGNGAINFIGKTKDIKVYNTALTDAELIALTS